MKMNSDLTYTGSADKMFVTFVPNTKAGEQAWRDMHATAGAEWGTVFYRHATSTIKQLRAAGYTVSKAPPAKPISDAELDDFFALSDSRPAHTAKTKEVTFDQFAPAGSPIRAAIDYANA